MEYEDSDQIGYDDVVLGAAHIAAGRNRHGVPAGCPCCGAVLAVCVQDGCAAPVAAHDTAWCVRHDGEVNEVLDATWPPVIE